MSIVANAGPLIALSRIEYLYLLLALYDEVIVPPAVYREVTFDATRSGAGEIAQAAWIHQETATDTIAVERLQYWLDDGESEAIVLAQSMQLRLLIDERRGRTIAATLGVSCTGTIGVLLAAKQAGHIPTVTPLLDALQRAGVYLSSGLRGEVRRMSGESEE
jgi:hypothetical protein